MAEGNIQISNYIRKSYSATKSYSANSTVSFTGDDLGVSNPEGYMPLCIRSLRFTPGNIVLNNFNLGASGSTTMLIGRNDTNTSGTVDANIQIIYAPTSMINFS